MIEDLTQGLEGELGYKGERGYSAYEIAVQNGYEGTEQEWIDHFGLDLTNYVQTSDVVDNLTSDVTNYPLSAKQGKALKTLVDDLDTSKADASSVYTKSEVNSTISEVNSTINNVNNQLSNFESNFYFSTIPKQTWDGSQSYYLNYPDGFTRANTVLIGATAVSYYNNSDNIILSSNTETYATDDSGVDVVGAVTVFYESNRIVITPTTKTYPTQFNLIFMKFVETNQGDE
jgi:hypothetical protein